MFFLFRKRAAQAEKGLESVLAEAEALKGRIVAAVNVADDKHKDIVAAMSLLASEARRIKDVKLQLGKIDIKF